MGVINVVDEALPQLAVRRWLVIFGYVVVVHDVRHVSFPRSASGDGPVESSNRTLGGAYVVHVLTTYSLWSKAGTSDNAQSRNFSRLLGSH